MLTKAHLINRTPSKLLNRKTPYEVLHTSQPSYNEIRGFGTLCFARNNPHEKDKFSPRSRRCVFLGYPFGEKGWKVYHLETQEIFTSRDVVFDEATFPFANGVGQEPSNTGPIYCLEPPQHLAADGLRPNLDGVLAEAHLGEAERPQPPNRGSLQMGSQGDPNSGPQSMPSTGRVVQV